jgi:hypothetical protein
MEGITMIKTAVNCFALMALLNLPLVAIAQDGESAETQAEQSMALAAEASPDAPAAIAPPDGPQGVSDGPLLIGVDDVNVDAQRVDVVTNAFSFAFNGVQVWGVPMIPSATAP